MVTAVRARRGCGKSIGLAASVATICLGSGIAAADGGGVSVPDPPKVRDVRCVETCAGMREATAGSRVELTGRHLGEVKTVAFSAAGGGRIEVDPTRVGSRRVKAKVPDGAETGRPKVEDAYGSTDASPEELRIVAPEEIPEGGQFKLASAKANPGTVFSHGKRDAAVRYVFEGGEASDVRVQVVNRRTGKVVSSWVERAQEPFVENRTRWNGRKDGGGEARNGHYRFKLGPVTGGAETTDGARFDFYRYKFPVRGPHSYGDGIGAGRGHQGQDVFASCGTPMVAARAGTVEHRQYHSSAGYYLVIDAKGTGRDYVYMHMLRRDRAQQGERVRTGERIGFVGETGNASGCHVHFEIWSAPGWYEGGSFTNPTDDLKKWDGWS